MKIGFIGLGNMGRNMALNINEAEDIEVVAWNRSVAKRERARDAGLHVVETVANLVAELAEQERKVIFLMVAAGSAVDAVLFGENGLESMLSAGDIVIDGANSFFAETQARAEKLGELGIELLDAGVSGGVEKARTGASVMVGGSRPAYEFTEFLFKALAAQSGYGYFGASGAGHFVKMVHNGIEYGMMQALAEGLNIIKHSQFGDSADLLKLTDVWNHSSIIASNLVGFMNQAMQNDPQLERVQPEIGSLGTGRWTVEQALQLGVPANAIAAAVFARYSSRESDEFLFKAIQAIRAEFGAHSSEERPE